VFCVVEASFQDTIVGEEQSLSAYLSSSPEPLLRLVGECFPLSTGLFGADYKESVHTHHMDLLSCKATSWTIFA